MVLEDIGKAIEEEEGYEGLEVMMLVGIDEVKGDAICGGREDNCHFCFDL